MSFEYRAHERCACSSNLSHYVARADKSGAFVLRGTKRVYERPRPFRISHIALDLQLDHPGAQIEGSAELSIVRVDPRATELRLDAVEFDIDSVHVRATRKRGRASKNQPWRAAEIVYDGEQLHVRVGSELDAASLRVRYRAAPRRGMYFLSPDEAVPDRPEQIWTQCQDEDARHIFPCHDKPHVRQTMDVRISVRPGWFVLSNGQLSSGKRRQREGHFHYRMREPLPSYLFSVVAGKFAVLEDHLGDLPVTYYVPPGREQDGRRTFAKTPEMIRLFAQRTGMPYPWSKYAQIVVSDFIFGGMENTSATTMYAHILLDERAAIDVSSDGLIAHELAHQWFGDLVTCRDWSHGWLNEGFATFFEHVWREHDLGTDEYLHGLRGDLHAYLGEASSRYQRPVVCSDYEAPIDIFDRHLYEKGALTLHLLRSQLGDEIFWKGVGRYLTKHAGGVVETRDLQRALEEVSGDSLEQVFEQNLFRAGHPNLEVTVAHSSDMLAITVKQQGGGSSGPFCVDLDFDVAVTDGPVERYTRRVDSRRHTFSFAGKRPRFVVVDPDLRVLGRVRTRAPADMLRSQLAEAPTARGRVLAAEALGKRSDPATIRALGDAISRSRQFWGVRAAACSALGRIRSSAAFERLARAARVKHPKVRRAAVVALGQFKTPAAAALLGRAARSDASVLVAAAACRALGSTRQPAALEVLSELIDRPSWADALRSGALTGLARLGDKEAIAILSDNTKYGVPNRGRRTAIAGLPKLSHDRETRELLEELLRDEDPHVRVSVAEALGELGDIKAGVALRVQLDRDLDARVRRRIREVLRDLGGADVRETRRLREEVEELRRKHGELQAELGRFEERLKAQEKPTRKRKTRRRKPKSTG